MKQQATVAVRFTRAYLLHGRVHAIGERARLSESVARQLLEWGVAELVDGSINGHDVRLDGRLNSPASRHLMER